METISHEEGEYAKVKSDLTKKNDEYFGEFIQVSTFLSRYWSGSFTITEMQVLFFLIGRTLTFKKRADTVAFRHFIEGVKNEDGVVCTGSGLKEKAIRAALGGLVDKKCIKIHTFISGNVERLWRIYEINVVQILGIRSMKVVESRSKTVRKVAPKPLLSEVVPPSSEKVGISNRLVSNREHTNVCSSAPSLPSRKRIDRAVIATDCKQEQWASVAELQQAIATRHSQNRAARVDKYKTVPKTKWKTVDIQALLDAARAEVQQAGYPTPRIVVVAKNIGVLHARMLAAEIADPLGFFAWVLQNWETVANANRRSKARQARDTKATSTEMSMSPSFNELAFRAPYFITFYNDREQVQVNKERVVAERERKVTETVKASQEFLQTKREQARELDLRREAERAQSTQNVRRVRRVAPVDFQSNEEPPQYRSRITE